MYEPNGCDRVAGGGVLRRWQAPVADHAGERMSHRRGVRRAAARLALGEPIPVREAPSGPPNRRAAAATTERIRLARATFGAESRPPPAAPGRGAAA